MNGTAIQTQTLTRTFGEIRAVDGLNLEIPSGIVFGFLGPNGSGKTTTIRLLLGLLEPTAGSAEVLGHPIPGRADAVRERSGALLEHSGLYERLSAEDNLEFFGRIYRMPAAQRRERTRELLTSLGLWERREEPVANWSRGMRQKLAVARALLHRPSLLFLDEPTNGLDPVAAASLREALAGLVAHEGVTVFLTTHNLAEAEKLCHEVGVIRNGRLLAVGRLDQLRARAGGFRLEVLGRGFTPDVVSRLDAHPLVAAVQAQNNHLTITLTEPADTAPLISLLVQAGGQVEEVRKGKASLEEAFLALVQDEETEPEAV